MAMASHGHGITRPGIPADGCQRRVKKPSDRPPEHLWPMSWELKGWEMMGVNNGEVVVLNF